MVGRCLWAAAGVRRVAGHRRRQHAARGLSRPPCPARIGNTKPLSRGPFSRAPTRCLPAPRPCPPGHREPPPGARRRARTGRRPGDGQPARLRRTGEHHMKTTDPYGITTVEQLRARIGEPHPLIPHKLWPALEPAAIEFIKRSPFLLLATADTAGNMDVSPKGDGPGFVVAENETTLLI